LYLGGANFEFGTLVVPLLITNGRKEQWEQGGRVLASAGGLVGVE
jgi:hypothetical protein